MSEVAYPRPANAPEPEPRLSLAELNALGFIINITNEIGLLPLETILRQAGFNSDPLTQQLTEKRGPCTNCGAHTHVILIGPGTWLCLICRLNQILGPENEPTTHEPGQAEPTPALCPSPGRAGSARPTIHAAHPTAQIRHAAENHLGVPGQGGEQPTAQAERCCPPSAASALGDPSQGGARC